MKKTLVMAGCTLTACTGMAFGQAHVALGHLPAGGHVDYDFMLLTGEIYIGMTTPLGSLGTNFATPDTRLSMHQAGGSAIIDNDDAGVDGRGGGAVGPVRGSAIRYGAGGTDNYTARVRGFGAGDTGSFAITSAKITPGMGYDFNDIEGNDTPADAQLISLGVMQAKVGFGSLTNDDIDYFAVNMLAGDVLSVMTAPMSSLASQNFLIVDTRLDIRDGAGNIIITNDDAGSDGWGATSGLPVRGSVLRYEATADGVVYFAVRGFGSNDVGDYAVLVSLIPAPGAGVVLLAGLGVAARRRRA